MDTTSEVVSAEFPGGAAAVMNFISGQVQYPESAKADGIEGKVFVEFTISESGEVANAHVIESLHPALDSAAVAAAMSMPAWAPATKEGKAIATTITLPVSVPLGLNFSVFRSRWPGPRVLGPPFLCAPR